MMCQIATYGSERLVGADCSETPSNDNKFPYSLVNPIQCIRNESGIIAGMPCIIVNQYRKRVARLHARQECVAGFREIYELTSDASEIGDMSSLAGSIFLLPTK